MTYIILVTLFFVATISAALIFSVIRTRRAPCPARVRSK